MRARHLLLLLVLVAPSAADYLVLSRNATVREQPSSASSVINSYSKGQVIRIRGDGEMENRWYPVTDPETGRPGWTFQSMGRRFEGEPDVPEAEGDLGTISICSFNIQFLGNSERRDSNALASIVSGYDIVVVQELVSPPFEGTFPDGSAFNPDPQSAEFFNAMTARGFVFILSEEDTGTGDTIHINGSRTEWWVTFYKPGRVHLATDLPTGFLAADRSNHDDYERVPYAFGFRSPDGNLDFVLISVHLQPDPGTAERARRKHELASIKAWIDAHDEVEHDFVVLGDMNLQNATEIADATPVGFVSLNNDARPTNTKGDEPYDHVMINLSHTAEVDLAFGFVIVNLRSEMRAFWQGDAGAYPGDPYDHDEFRAVYSDHNPVVFRLTVPDEDDD